MAKRGKKKRPTTAPTPARQQLRGDALVAQLGPEQSLELLAALHLVTRNGTMNADAHRKLKQINHLMTLLAPALPDLLAVDEDAVIVDAGAGNGYLAFLLYEAMLRPSGRGRLIGVERRADLVARSAERAEVLGMERLAFVEASVADLLPTDAAGGAEEKAADAAAPPPGVVAALDRVDAVVALHACDRATDEAIVLGLRREASVIAVVPCCQAELAACLVGKAVAGPLAPMWRAGMHRREFGAHLTNVIRTLVLEAHGYRVRVTELVGWEHSLKNELIVAVRHQRGNALARRQLDALLRSLPPLTMWLLAATGLASTTSVPPSESTAAPAIGA